MWQCYSVIVPFIMEYYQCVPLFFSENQNQNHFENNITYCTLKVMLMQEVNGVPTIISTAQVVMFHPFMSLTPDRPIIHTQAVSRFNYIPHINVFTHDMSNRSFACSITKYMRLLHV